MIFLSTFERRAIATVCMLENMSAADDPPDDGELIQYHAKEVPSDDPRLPADIHRFTTAPGRYFVIVDQYGNAAGCLSVYDDAATFFYSVITG